MAAGEGQPEATLVYLPGSLCDDRLFTHQRDTLSPRYRSTTVDLRGMSSIDDMAVQALDSVTGPVIPIGLSMGGIVAAAMIEQAPDRLVGCVLLDTNLGPPDDAQLRARHRWANMTRAGQFPDVVQELVPTLTVDPELNGPLVADMALAVGPRRFLDQNRALVNRDRDRTPAVTRFGGPLLVLVGERDPVCRPELHRQLAVAAVDGRLQVIDGAGHLSTIDRPEDVSAAIERWLHTYSF